MRGVHSGRCQGLHLGFPTGLAGEAQNLICRYCPVGSLSGARVRQPHSQGPVRQPDAGSGLVSRGTRVLCALPAGRAAEELRGGQEVSCQQVWDGVRGPALR